MDFVDAAVGSVVAIVVGVVAAKGEVFRWK